MLAILEYNAGNQTSVKRALHSLEIQCEITSDPSNLHKYDGIIFPGVGAAGETMANLKSFGLDIAIKQIAERNQPLLGICMGCQILLTESEEDNTKTLNIISGKTRHFSNLLQLQNINAPENESSLKIPHMGWNGVKRVKDHFLWNKIPDNAEFYFVHSYYVEPTPELVLGITSYGKDFCSFYGKNNLWAVQFHPEKSGPAGLQLLKNFNDFTLKN